MNGLSTNVWSLKSRSGSNELLRLNKFHGQTGDKNFAGDFSKYLCVSILQRFQFDCLLAQYVATFNVVFLISLKQSFNSFFSRQDSPTFSTSQVKLEENDSLCTKENSTGTHTNHKAEWTAINSDRAATFVLFISSMLVYICNVIGLERE